MHLQSEGLEICILPKNTETKKDKASTMVKLHPHLREDLKQEYQSVKGPYELWSNLAKRYGHQKNALYPLARYEWLNMHIQDFKTIIEYNSDVRHITSTMKICGETVTDKDMLEKTVSTFSATNMLLQQQYGNCGFTQHSDLNTCFLVAEQNNELLFKI